MCRGCAYIAIYAQHVHSPELSTFTNIRVTAKGLELQQETRVHNILPFWKCSDIPQPKWKKYKFQ